MGYGLTCTGNIINNGSNITQMGFNYSGATTGTTIITPVQSGGGNFTGNIIGLLPGSVYVVKAFAINSAGWSVAIGTMSGKTLGTISQSTITINSNPVNLLYELGTINTINIHGTTIKNTEEIFNGIDIYMDNVLQISFPGYVPTYNTNVNFETIGDIYGDELSMDSIIKSSGKFGNPQYTNTQTLTAKAVYPFLITIDMSLKNSNSYYLNIFCMVSEWSNYKFIKEKNNIVDFNLTIANNGYINRTCHLGFYYKYGTISKVRIGGIEVSFTLGTSEGSTTAIVKSYSSHNIWSMSFYIINFDLSMYVANDNITISIEFV